ncbi:MAG: family transposase [Actinomycetia bacterium]|jgi:hypothetical protein|nr:family transposase [Actinomycetes bacterium]
MRLLVRRTKPSRRHLKKLTPFVHDHGDLADAEPDTLRYRLLHLPARLSSHARRRWLKISRDWVWREAFLTCWKRLNALPAAPA